MEIQLTGVLVVAAGAFAVPLVLGCGTSLRLPSVALEIVVGILIGPVVLRLVEIDAPLRILSVLKTLYLRRGDETYDVAARFWGKIFAVTFVMGVVTGIPLEFRFGTNWAAFSTFTGDIIAQTLAMEGAFAFFQESAFLGIFHFGERRFGQRVHWFSALMVFLGTWASGYFIMATSACRQNSVGYEEVAGGGMRISDY